MPTYSIQVPMNVAAKARIAEEKARDRRQRYEDRTGRKRHDENDSRPNGHERSIHYSDYRFVGWDGEATRDTGYCLFGSSDGHELCDAGGLSTAELFDLLLDARREDPYTIFIWFGGRYDWDEILRKSVSMRTIARLKKAGTAWWGKYRLTECEGKIYSVQKDGITATLYEISGWFHCRYDTALERYGIGSAEERSAITSDKNRRNEFLWEDIDEIREYMRLELKLMPSLMDRIREICLSAGFSPRGWYGPSALARQLLTRHKILNCMAETPEPVNLAGCYAFAGGRFEDFRGGILTERRNTTVDQNSAYMYAALRLPNLSRGQWRHGCGYEPGKFAVYHIRYHARDFEALRPYPLFRRLKNGNVCWPRRVEGWYWAPEAELVADDPDATFIESWVFDETDESDRPFSFVQEVFRQRQVFQRLPESNPSRAAEQAMKWALASIYGQLARRVGWNRKLRKAPVTHQIEWAGWITSACRAEMYRKAVAAGDRLISIDTDSVTSLGDAPDDLDCGNNLGQWKAETCDGGIFFQSGIFFTTTGGEWSKGKSRGVDRQRKTPELTPEMLETAIRDGCTVQLTPRRRYVTLKMALNGVVDAAGNWIEHDGNKLTFGGGGKRYHNPLMCWKYCHDGLHGFIPVFIADNPFDIKSYPHVLPWKQKSPPQYDYTDYLWVDTDLLGDEEWHAELLHNYRYEVVA